MVLFYSRCLRRGGKASTFSSEPEYLHEQRTSRIAQQLPHRSLPIVGVVVGHRAIALRHQVQPMQVVQTLLRLPESVVSISIIVSQHL